MTKLIQIAENNIHLVFQVTDQGDVRLAHCSARPPDRDFEADVDALKWYRAVELQVTGENQDDHHGEKHTGTAPANRLKYSELRDLTNEHGRKIELELHDADRLTVVCHYQLYGTAAVIRCWTEVTCRAGEPVGLEYVSSFSLNGLGLNCPEGWQDALRLHIPHSTWFAETQWTDQTLTQLGYQQVSGASMHRITRGATGSWSASNCLPMGAVHNTATGEVWGWQIEACGSWHWELAELGDSLYLQLSGPTENENHWWKQLAPGETFTSIPAAVAITSGSAENAWRELTTYRRAMRRPHPDLESLPIIFNDYMNCLMGDPTTEKLLPLIDAAADAGCEVFCIDSGWYDSGFWWDKVGEWQPSADRFPGDGIQVPIQAIRDKGMVPGLWLEIEVMGTKCPLASRVPDDWFFTRHGKRIIDHGRYQLDFRNPAVRAHADAVVDRLVGDWGIGYIKNDYNIQIGPGTERDADSFGDGLLQHNRAFISWLSDVQDRYPDLILEACASGGMRMGYGFLETCAIQSSSDQMDYRKYASIAANCPSIVAPEQCGIWSYPLRDGDREEVIFNMINAMLGRIHQSGHLPELTPERRALVHEGLAYYKTIRTDLKRALPIWPLGLGRMCDGWHALGLETSERLHLAVWRTHSTQAEQTLHLAKYTGRKMDIRCGYPSDVDSCWDWHPEAGTLTVTFPESDMARLFCFEWQ